MHVKDDRKLHCIRSHHFIAATPLTKPIECHTHVTDTTNVIQDENSRRDNVIKTIHENVINLRKRFGGYSLSRNKSIQSVEIKVS